MNGLTWWLKGYVELAIVDATRDEDVQRFFSICKCNGICIKDIVKKDRIYRFVISIEDYIGIKKIVRKTHILPKLENKYGLPFLYSKNKNRQSFVVGLIIGVTLFYVASVYIWNISVEGENYYTESELIDFMRTQGIEVGTKINDIECEKVEKLIRRKYSDIGWVSVQIEGTYLTVSVKENIKYDIMSDNSINNSRKYNIIASEDGIVDSILVRTGEAKVSVGDVVKKGDILISGEIDILSDTAEVVDKKNVHADGEVYIKYDKEYYYELGRQYKCKCYTPRKSKGIRMYFGNTRLVDVNFYHLLTKKIDNYDFIVNNYNVMLCKNLYTPFRVEKCVWQNYIYEDKLYTDKELEYKANKAYNRYVEELNSANKDIIYNDVETQVLDEAVVSKGYITIKSKQTLRE